MRSTVCATSFPIHTAAFSRVLDTEGTEKGWSVSRRWVLKEALKGSDRNSHGGELSFWAWKEVW